MTYKEAIQHAMDGDSVIFLGAGYSAGAVNLEHTSLPNGAQLARILCKECEIEDKFPLEDAAEAYVSKFGDNSLIKKLRSLYSIKEVSSFHKTIINLPWRRIYTTNFDDLIECASSQESINLTSITLNQKLYNIPRGRIWCIHLNGFIRNLDRDTLQSELKLTETSYLTSSIEDSEWLMLFRQDIQFSKSVFFVGYSLFDLDIRRILFDSRSLKEKTFFITGQNPDKLSINRISKFGTLKKINGVEFADNINEESKTYSRKDNNEFTTLSVNEYKIELPDKDIKDTDFINLLLYGSYTNAHISKSFSAKNTYYLERTATQRVFDYFNSNKNVVVITSLLGNGKSLLKEGIKYRARENGYRVFEVEEHTSESVLELERLSKLQGNILVVFENYHRWLDEIELYFSNIPKDINLLLLSRTYLNDIAFERLLKIFEKDFIPEIFIDKLDDLEIGWFIKAFNEYGLWGEFAARSESEKERLIKKVCDKQIHAILLRLIDSPDISKRLGGIFKEIKNVEDLYKIIVRIFILNVLDKTPSTEMLVDMWGSQNMRKNNLIPNTDFKELIDFKENKILVRSSIACQHLLRKHTDLSIIVQVLIHLTKRLDKYSRFSNNYFQMLKDLSKFSSLQLIFPYDTRTSNAIMDYYESIKNIRSFKNKPLFWLQYAIASMGINDLFRAKKYFKTAYSFAEKNQWWDTFQIDNHYARFLLEESLTFDNISKAIKNFRKAQLIINRQMANEKMHHPYRVAIKYQDFFDKYSNILEKDHIEWIKRAVEHVNSRIEELPDYRRANRFVKQCKIAMLYIYDEAEKLLLKFKKSEALPEEQNKI